MAAANNVGFAYGFNVHDEDDALHGRPDTTDIPEAGHLVRDVIYGANYTASHLVHFYHLAALDFVDVANVGLGLNKAPFCPRFGPDPGDPLYPYYYRIPGNVSAFLTAKYVLALKIRRMCNQIGGLWGGRAPFIQGLTPGGCSPSVSSEAIAKTEELLYEGGSGGTPSAPAAGTILAFVGTPFDFANYVANTTVLDFSNLPIVGTITDAATPYAGTMMFDVVAAACFYPEYFWLGNAYERFLAYGVFEQGDPANAIGDNRLFSRGRKNTGAAYSNQTGVLPAAFGAPGTMPAEWKSVLQQNVYEGIANSHYLYNGGGKNAWKQPLNGETSPEPRRTPTHATYSAYSWVKSPRYKDFSDPVHTSGAVPYEVGPLARMQVNGDYYGGVLYDLGAMGITGAIPFTDGTKIPVGPFAGVELPRYGDPGPDLGAIFPSGTFGSMPDLGPAGYNLTYNGDSSLDRYAARQIECWKVANAMVSWLNRLKSMIGAVTSITRNPLGAGGDKYYAESYGWTEAPRGALGHWMKTNMTTGKIENYQCVVPTTWNASPRDAVGQPGPAEKAMENVFVKDVNHPLEVLRVAHSWDFCSACSIHLVQKKGRGKTEEKTIRIEPAPTPG